MISTLDVANLRQQFPALGNNPDFVFADNAGGSQILGSVVERISDYLLKTNVQMADYSYSHRAAAAVADGKAAAALLADTQPENVMMGQSATQLFETLARMIEATVRAQRGAASSSSLAWKEGDEVIVSAADHEANRGAWIRLARALGLRLVEWPVTPVAGASVDSHVGLDPVVLRKLVTPRTRIVAFTGSSNVLGSHWSDEDFASIARAVREKSQGHAYICIDAVAFAPHRRLRPERWGVDFVIWSWYKVFGPHVASMYVSPRARDVQDDGSIDGSPATPLLSKLNHHFLHSVQGSMYPYQPSSEQYELIVCVAAVVDYLIWIGQTGGKSGTAPARLSYSALFTDDAKQNEQKAASAAIDACYNLFAQHEQTLATQILHAIKSRPQDLAILGDPSSHAERAPTVAFAPAHKLAKAASHSNVTSKVLHSRVVRDGRIGAQVGHMYAYALVDGVPGLDAKDDGVMRVSFVHYNTAEEVASVCEAVDAACVKHSVS